MTTKRGGTAAFFLIAFAFTWGLQAPGVLNFLGFLPGPASGYLGLAALGMLGPSVAAVVMLRREGQPLSGLVESLCRFRVGPLSYAVALAPALLLALLLYALNQAGRSGPIAYIPAAGGVVFGLVASLIEEIGWRGFALPRLQSRYGSFAASGILGLVWYLWHLPMFVAQSIPFNLVLAMLLFFVGASLLLTWLYNGSGGSLVVVTVAHLAAHLNNSHRALPDEVVPTVVHAIIYAGMGLFVMRHALPPWRGKRRRTPRESDSRRAWAVVPVRRAESMP